MILIMTIDTSDADKLTHVISVFQILLRNLSRNPYNSHKMYEYFNFILQMNDQAQRDKMTGPRSHKRLFKLNCE